MNKLILSLDGGGIRGAATARFLALVEAELAKNERGVSLYDYVDLFAGTSTGSIIALGLSVSRLKMRHIDDMYNYENARSIFSENKGFLEVDGVNAPRYEASGKTSVLKSKLGKKTLGKITKGKHVIAVAYDVEKRAPVVFKSTNPDHHDLFAYDIADASSAAPTYFPTKAMTVPAGSNVERWLIDGGVVANNPTMCAISEARQIWTEVPMDDISVLSVGTGSATRKINGPQSTKWGGIGWFTKGHILDVLADERVVGYQAMSILGRGKYIRVNAELGNQTGLQNPPDDAMDDISTTNIDKLRALGEYWFDRYGAQAVALIRGKYQGPSLDRIDPITSLPIGSVKEEDGQEEPH